MSFRGLFWLALLLATLVMTPTMVARWRQMRGGRSQRHSTFDALCTIVSRIWLPAAVAVPLVYAVRLLAF